MLPDRMEYIIGDSPTTYRNQVTMETPWGKVCPFTMTASESDDFTFTATLDTDQLGFELALIGDAELD